jgi:hypothetical protein
MLPEDAVTVAVKETVWPVTRAFKAPMFQVTTQEEKAQNAYNAEVEGRAGGHRVGNRTSVRLDPEVAVGQRQ